MALVWYAHRVSCALWRLMGFRVRRALGLERLLLFSIVKPYTMVSRTRLRNTYELAKRCEHNGIPGAFVECGTWRGGCAAVMAYVAHGGRRRRVIHLFDSFQGLPEPTSHDGETARRYAGGSVGGRLSAIHKCVALRTDVDHLFFDLLNLESERLVVHEGWFQDTVPPARDLVGPIAILRLDGDWYESTRLCLATLYDRVVPGGFVIVDDYGHWEGCKKAVDEFLSTQPHDIDLIRIDYTGRYFRKPARVEDSLIDPGAGAGGTETYADA
jgi:O-methyltransferase